MDTNHKKYLQTETDWLDLNVTSDETKFLKTDLIIRWRLLFLSIIIILVCGSTYFAFNNFIKGHSSTKDSVKSELSNNNDIGPGQEFNGLVLNPYDKKNDNLDNVTNSPEGDVTPTDIFRTQQIVIIAVTNPPAITTSKPTITTTYYGFEGSTQGWSCSNLTSGPSITTEWKNSGSYSLKCVADTNPGTAYNVSRTCNENYSNGGYLRATVRCKDVSGMTANLFILSVSGSDNVWSESGRVEVGSSSVTLSLSLSNISSRNNVKAIGVEFMAGSNTDGTAIMYIDDVYVN